MSINSASDAKKSTLENTLCVSFGRFCSGACVSLLAITAVSGVSAAHAGTISTDISRTDYHAHVYGMPDLDQQRDPDTWETNRNMGRMYCGPTSAANVLSYFVQEGYEDIDAPTVDFEPLDSEELSVLETLSEKAKASAADDFIAELADEMDTGAYSWSDYDSFLQVQKMRLGLPLDAEDYSAGTSYSDLVSGLEDRLPSDFSVRSKGNKECFSDSEYTITPRRIFEELEKGNVVILSIGRYVVRPFSTYHSRLGGHYTVVTGISRTETIMGEEIVRLWYHDSNRTGDGRDSQSTFTTEVTELERTTVTMSEDCSRTRWEMMDGRTDYFLDGMIVVNPPAL